jgi:hypothetical protein
MIVIARARRLRPKQSPIVQKEIASLPLRLRSGHGSQ